MTWTSTFIHHLLHFPFLIRFRKGSPPPFFWLNFATVREQYNIEPRHWIAGLALGFALLLSDYGIKLAARLGGCSIDLPIETEWFRNAWSIPEICEGTRLAGAALVLLPQLRDSGPFGLFGPLSPLHGQFLALAGFAIATAITIFILRWRWQSSGDTQLLACLWAGIALDAIPRFASNGLGLTEMMVFGLPLGISDFLLTWALIWLAWRIATELSA